MNGTITAEEKVGTYILKITYDGVKLFFNVFNRKGVKKVSFSMRVSTLDRILATLKVPLGLYENKLRSIKEGANMREISIARNVAKLMLFFSKHKGEWVRVSEIKKGCSVSEFYVNKLLSRLVSAGILQKKKRGVNVFYRLD